MYLVSSCLIGDNCKYSGGNNLSEAVVDFLKDKEYIKVCPEELGGLPTPRDPAEIVGDRVLSKVGNDVTHEFRMGAKATLIEAIKNGIGTAILKEGSPSCGCNKIYDGTFSSVRIDGMGLTAQLLAANDIDVYSEDQLSELEG